MMQYGSNSVHTYLYIYIYIYIYIHTYTYVYVCTMEYCGIAGNCRLEKCCTVSPTYSADTGVYDGPPSGATGDEGFVTSPLKDSPLSPQDAHIPHSFPPPSLPRGSAVRDTYSESVLRATIIQGYNLADFENSGFGGY